MSHNKSLIRKTILIMRDSLAEEDVEHKSKAIRERLYETQEYKTAATVHCYVSIRNEVDTRVIIRDMIRSKISVIVPVTDVNTKVLRHSRITDIDTLRPGTMGIPQPERVDMKELDLDKVDLVILPGVAFDRFGNRIGFGGGFYDRFLSEIDAVKVGLAYEFQIVDKIEADPHDETVDRVITQDRIYEK